ncbi:MAG: tRNA preQ1(34) S-adenosylmethionine ribosyltransferase-isomerase QueA [Treponema sp.]|jgi:S-adenosylmethionine:tRNA ribosyltransferase-isomerase|nr:tRNA preQ1(34) S-adenosylmethionine ribosyltransferase-isomerase QueA [Treponema sp.]
MKTNDFFFELPAHLIAQYPPQQRGQSRLMALDRASGKRRHAMVTDLPRLLRPGDLLVFNDSKVRKARIIGISQTSGAKAEFLLLSPHFRTRAFEQVPSLSEAISSSGTTWKALVQRARRRRPGSRYIFYDAEGREIARAEITGGEGEFRFLAFDRPIDDAWLDRYGCIPLPPYIRREDEPADTERYQTVYAAVPGSTAAPTAGLHFTRELLGRLAAAGIESVFITLHVGLGTFLPVRSEHIEDHVMHEELFSIGGESAVKIEQAKAEGRRLIAVGTTSVRTLESAWDSGRLRRGPAFTSIFIYPGYRFKAVDALFTNFHTPKSTLLMLTAAFAGRELIQESYAEAIREGYRFFSYGDSMLIV